VLGRIATREVEFRAYHREAVGAGPRLWPEVRLLTCAGIGAVGRPDVCVDLVPLRVAGSVEEVAVEPGAALVGDLGAVSCVPLTLAGADEVAAAAVVRTFGAAV